MRLDQGVTQFFRHKRKTLLGVISGMEGHVWGFDVVDRGGLIRGMRERGGGGGCEVVVDKNLLGTEKAVIVAGW